MKTHTHAIGSRTRARFVLAGVSSVVAWVSLRILAPGPAIPWSPAMISAAERMAGAMEAVARHCEETGIQVDAGRDPNGTCLIGPDVTELFTTSGQLEAKRSATNPDMAGLLTHLLEAAGVAAGDTVAVGASGSFPALMVATVVATEALGAIPVTLLSLGASAYGATRPDFHLLDLHELLREEGYFGVAAAAVSLGGRGDVGGEFDPDFRGRLSEELRASGIPFLFDSDLPSNVARRMRIYGSPAAFVNIGGADANIGISPRILGVPPGLVQGLDLPPDGERGVLFQMAAAGVPVIHLLHIRGLALRFGLSWDPVPLPSPGSTFLGDESRGKGIRFWLLTVLYFGLLVILAYPGRGSRSGSGP